MKCFATLATASTCLANERLRSARHCKNSIYIAWLKRVTNLWEPTLASLVPSRPRRFRMWRHLSSLSGKFAQHTLKDKHLFKVSIQAYNSRVDFADFLKCNHIPWFAKAEVVVSPDLFSFWRPLNSLKGNSLLKSLYLPYLETEVS